MCRQWFAVTVYLCGDKSPPNPGMKPCGEDWTTCIKNQPIDLIPTFEKSGNEPCAKCKKEQPWRQKQCPRTGVREWEYYGNVCKQPAQK